MLTVSRSQLLPYGAAALSVGSALLLSLLLWPALEMTFLPLFFAAVMFSAWYGGLGPGIIATALAVASMDYFLMSPHTLVFESGADATQLVVFSSVALLISVLNAELRTAKQQIQSSLSKLQVMARPSIDNTREGIGLINSDIRIKYVNDRLAEMLGYGVEEMGDRPIYDFIEPEYRKKLAEKIERTKRGMKEQFDFRYRRKDESLLWARVTIDPILNRNGEFREALVMLTEITDRRKGDEIGSQWAEIFQQVGWGVAIGSADGKTLEMSNPAFAEMHGYTVEELIGTPISDIFAPDSRDQLPQHIEMTHARGHHTFESKHLHKDGTAFPVLISATAIADKDGRVLYRAVNVQDISDRKQMEAELYRREQQFKTLADNAPDIIARFDRQLRHVYISPAIETATGIPPEACIGKTHDELGIPQPISAPCKKYLRQTFATRQECNYEFQFDTRDGTRYFQTRMVPEFAADGSVESVLTISRDLTNYKRVEQALRKSEARFRQIFDSNTIGMGFWEIDGQITAANDAMLDMLGYTRQEFESQGLSWKAITPPEYFPMDEQARQEALEKGFCKPYEKEHIRKDGRRISVLAGGATFEDSTESGVFFLIDRTDRKRAEQTQQYLYEASKILASSLDYETTLASVAHLSVPHLADWCTVHVVQEDGSIQALATAHINPEKVVWAKQVNQKYPLDPNAERGAANVLRTGVAELYPYIPEHLLVEAARDEEHLQLLRDVGFKSVMIVPLLAHGRILGTISFISAESGRRYDRSDLGLAEELARRAALAVDHARLYNQAQRARQIAEEAADRTAQLQAVTAALSEALTPDRVAQVVIDRGIAALGAHAGSIVLLNENQTALKPLGAIGYPPEVLNTWESFSITAPVPLAETVRTGQPSFYESIEEFSHQYPSIADIPRVTGNKAFACIPLTVEGRTIGAMGLSFCQSRKFEEPERSLMLALGQQCAQAIARARLYEAEQQARADAEAANRVRDEFIAVLSHELRSPLNPILGWSKLLQMRKFDAAKTAHALETIERNAKLQARLIEDLLDISRILRGTLSLDIAPVDLSKTIEAAIETVRLAAEAKSIHIETAIAPDVRKVVGDPNRLQQVIWNLLSNAVKFTPPQGRVTIRLQCVGSYTQIQVSDTGKGISLEFLPYIFDYFRQADSKTTRAFGGLGLGLAIVRNLVELHGGCVKAESAGVDRGSTFTVTLPPIAGNPQAAEDKVSPTLSTNLEGVKVLVVDDEADTRDFLAFVLEDYGARVRAVESAPEAIAALSDFQPDLLLSDIGMPKMDGYMLIRKIRTMNGDRCGQIPAIALTAYAGDSDRRQILKSGFQQHLPKPVEPLELAATIARLVRRTGKKFDSQSLTN